MRHENPHHKIGGAVFSARHSFMPNRLGYCGPEENQLLFDAAVENKPTRELLGALQQFKGAYPYQRFIAREAGLQDPFDYRVTEAYWLGNSLLENIPPDRFYQHLRERLDSKFSRDHIKRFFDMRPYASFPHHALHVFNAFSSMGTVPDFFATGIGRDDKVGSLMDQCRISWGRISTVDGKDLIVEYEPIIRKEGRLLLVQPTLKRILRQIDGRGFVDNARPGDWVSFHWGFAASTLNESQVASLRKYTLRAMEIANNVPVPQ
jgi:hydrogenase maturation factor